MAKEYIFKPTQHGLVTNGDSYVRSIAIGVKRAWLRGYTVISSCLDMTDMGATPPLVTFTFYSQDSRGSTWGDWNVIERYAETLTNWDNAGVLNFDYRALSDFIIYDDKSGSYSINYAVNGWFTRQQVQIKWVIEADDTISD